MSAALNLSVVGASDFPTLLGVNRYESPTELWNRIVHGIGRQTPLWLDEAGELGTAHELGTAESLVRLRLGREPRLGKPPSRVRPAGEAWLRYSLDFVQGVDFEAEDFEIVPHEREAPALIECKYRGDRSFAAQGWGEDGSAGVPLDVYCQVQVQMAAAWLDRDWWCGTSVPELPETHVAVVAWPRLYHYTVPRDIAVGEALLERGRKWWRDYVETEVAPPLDGSEGASRFLASKHPSAVGKVREGTEEEGALVESYRRARERVEEAKKDLHRCQQLLESAIGDDRGISGEGYKITWANQRGAVDWRSVAESLAHRLELSDVEIRECSDFHRREPFRRFNARL